MRKITDIRKVTATASRYHCVSLPRVFMAVVIVSLLAALTINTALGEAAPSADEQQATAEEKNLTNPTGEVLPESATAVPMDHGQPIPAVAVPASTGFDFPVGTKSSHIDYVMNNCFGCDYLYYWGHLGEDFDNGRGGDPVYSASEGVVVWRGVGPGAWGNVIIIKHDVRGYPVYSQYAHMTDMWVYPGQTVGRRQVIGTVGTTGTSAPHLHFEIKDQPQIGHGYIGWYFTPRNTIQDPDTGINYISPSWFINNNRYFWEEFPQTPVPNGRHYYWTWYDNIEGRNWLLLANPEGGNTLTYDVNVQGICPDLAEFGGATVPAAKVMTPCFPSLKGGPVIATSLTGDTGLASQRIIWGTHSIEEVPGIEADRLSSHYYWPWYDMKSQGFKNWVLVANPSTSETVTASISFRDNISGKTVSGLYNIAPGSNVTPQFAGKMGGPVEVKAWVQGGSWDELSQQRPVIASQRMLLDDDQSFNEMPGIPAEELSNHYFWTWYDESVAGLKNWVLIANPSSTETLTASISFRNEEDGQMVTGIHNIEPGRSVIPRFSGKMGGPVEVKAWVQGGSWDTPSDRRPVIATQRSLWGGFSFDEVPGVVASTRAGDYHWTWYDMQSDGMKNWVLISNTNDDPIYYEISIPGINTDTYPGARGTVPAGENANIVFSGKMGGPVEVRSWTDSEKGTTASVLASQRVLYAGYFNEVTGTVLEN